MSDVVFLLLSDGLDVQGLIVYLCPVMRSHSVRSETDPQPSSPGVVLLDLALDLSLAGRLRSVEVALRVHVGAVGQVQPVLVGGPGGGGDGRLKYSLITGHAAGTAPETERERVTLRM